MKAQASAVTATGDTVKTSIGELTVPQTVRRIIGIWGYAIAAGAMTTAEAVTGILELESPDVNLAPLQLPLDCVSALTSGAVAFNPRIFPCNIAVPGGAKITGYMTMDMAQTGTLKGRWGLIYD